MKREISVDEHMNSYTQLLTDLVNLDVKIDEEDKAVILLNFFFKKSMRPLLLH